METFQNPEAPHPLARALAEERKALEHPRSARGATLSAALLAITASGCVTTTTVESRYSHTTGGPARIDSSNPQSMGNYREICKTTSDVLRNAQAQEIVGTFTHKDGKYTLHVVKLPNGHLATTRATGPNGEEFSCS